MDSFEGAGGERAIGVLLEDFFSEAAALGGGGGGRALHGEEVGGAVVEGDVYIAGHAGDDAGICDGVGSPGRVVSGGVVDGLGDEFVDGFAGFHEPVAEVGVLVEFVGLAGGAEDVFVVAFGEFFGHAAGGGGEGGFEDNLRGAAAKVEDGCCGGFVGAADLAEEVVGCYPGVDAFVFAVHDFDAAVLGGDEGEGVFCFDALADRGEDVLACVWAEFLVEFA